MPASPPRIPTDARTLQSTSSTAAVRASPHAVAPLPFATLPGMGARLRGLAPPGSPSRRRTVAGTTPLRGSPGVPLLPSHGHRSDRAFRRHPLLRRASPDSREPVRGPSPARPTLPPASLPWSVVCATRPKAARPRRPSDLGGPPGVFRPVQRPARVALTPPPEGEEGRGAPRPPLPRSSVDRRRIPEGVRRDPSTAALGVPEGAPSCCCTRLPAHTIAGGGRDWGRHA